MRKLILAAAGIAAAAVIPMSAASAQYYGRGYAYQYGGNRAVAREMRECRRELRRADSRREYNREMRECRRELARARWESRYGYNNRYGHYGSYYRSGYRW